MKSVDILTAFNERLKSICRERGIVSGFAVAESPASANAILSNAMKNSLAICSFIVSDSPVTAIYEDSHCVARIAVGVVLNRALQENAAGTLSLLSIIEELRSGVLVEMFDDLIIPSPVFSGMEFIRTGEGRFLNGYLLNFDFHYSML